MRVYLLDVGQGLAIVVQTQKKVLVYDTGPVFASGSSTGDLVLTPFLKSLGISDIDKMVISHPDNDHSGGVKSLIDNFKIKQIDASYKQGLLNYQKQINLCHEGIEWNWDNVHFEYLNPIYSKKKFGKINNSSCVLKISYKNKSILLPGDIEKPIENYLLDYHYGQLQADILIAPHHGSKTSSTIAFINAVKPEYVLFSTGFYNRYHHPAKIVVKRYLNKKVKMINSADNGAILINFNNNGKIIVK